MDLLEPYIWPKWVLRATFPGIRDCVRELLRVRMDALAFKFHQTKDLKISHEILPAGGGAYETR